MLSPASMLITGGAGFIGANFVYYMLEHYPDRPIIVLDLFTYAASVDTLEKAQTHKNFTLVKGDINDTALVLDLLRTHHVDTIVHFAAESHVDRSIRDPFSFIQANILGTYTLLQAARTFWIDEGNFKDTHRFHQVSTDEVYGSLTPDAPAFTETSAYDPRSPYSASKASADHFVMAWHHTYGLRCSISNCSNNYGPFHFPEKLIPLTLVRILHNRSIPVYGDGKQVRDWLFVEDHCFGISLVLEKGIVGESYNIGGVNEWANIDTIRLICRLLNALFAKDLTLAQRFPDAYAVIAGRAETLISFVADRPGHDRRYAIDPTKTKKTLGYQPQYSFDEGILKTIHWFLDNPSWWEPLLDR